MRTYYLTGCGVTIVCAENEDPKWFVDMVHDRGGIVTVERI